MKEKWAYFFRGLIGATVLYALLVLAVILLDTKLKDIRETRPVKLGAFVCDVDANISDTFTNDIVLMNNNLYRITFNSKYSNEQSCMKISDDQIVKLIGEYYVDSIGNVYTLGKDGLNIVENTNKIPEDLFAEDIVMAYAHGDANVFKYYVLKTDGKIYDIEFKRDYYFSNGEGKYRYTNILEEVYLEYEDAIKAFKVANGAISYVKTDKAVYTLDIVDDKCMDYADVECVYDLVKQDVNMDNIKFVDYYSDSLKYINKDNMRYSKGV